MARELKKICLVGLACDTGTPLALRFGYRFLKGGADVEEVYNFTYMHYSEG